MTEEIIKVIRGFIDPLVSNPDGLVIRELPSDRGESHKRFLVACDSADIAVLIGRHGTTANAIRTLLTMYGMNNKVHISISFEGLDEE